jgi:predicted DNA-binding antitoxin AbrB/MazE fold protein
MTPSAWYSFWVGESLMQDLDAVYHDGVFEPLTAPALPEGARVHLRVESAIQGEDSLSLASQVYEGLTAEQIAEIEAIALDRSRFMTRFIS